MKLLYILIFNFFLYTNLFSFAPGECTTLSDGSFHLLGVQTYAQIEVTKYPKTVPVGQCTLVSGLITCMNSQSPSTVSGYYNQDYQVFRDSGACPQCTLPLPPDFIVKATPTGLVCNDYLLQFRSAYPSAANYLYCNGCPDPAGNLIEDIYESPIVCSSTQKVFGLKVIGGSFDTAVLNICIDSCKDLSSIKVDFPQNLCVGNKIDYKAGYRGVLSWQTCNNTCYMIEQLPLNCLEQDANYIKTKGYGCDSDLNIPKYNCTDVNSSIPADVLYSCTPRNDNNRSSPCDDKISSLKVFCLSNQVVDGVCNDNGLKITSNTLKCIEKKPNCLLPFNEILDPVTNTCVCLSGYNRDSFGSCWKTIFLDINSSSVTSDQKATEKNAQQKNATDRKKYQSDQNSKNSNINSNNDGLNAKLSGIRNDLNTTNNLLSSIKNGKSLDMSEISISIGDGNTKLLGFIDDASKGMAQITADFVNLKTLVDNGFTLNKMSVGTTPSFSAVVYGKTISFDLCPTFGKFYPVFSFVFTLMFMYISIRIFLFSFLLKG